MIGIALVLVTYPDEEPYEHRHYWMSEGWLYAPVELSSWLAETQHE